MRGEISMSASIKAVFFDIGGVVFTPIIEEFIQVIKDTFELSELNESDSVFKKIAYL